MGSLRRFLPLLFLCCAVASLVSAQSVSVTFLDEWGAQTSRVLEEGKAFLRVVDPAANTSPGRDQVWVELSAAHSQDFATTNLVETGEATGIFEGEAVLSTDFYANYLADADILATWPQTWPPESLDIATATYGGASDSVEVGPSLVDLLDDGGRSPSSFAVGEHVRVRLRDRFADRYAGQGVATAVLTSSGGDSETLTLFETDGTSGVFQVSIPLVAGAPAAQDGRLQTADGETLSVSHADTNGFSSSTDTAAVTASSVRFIHWQERKPTSLFVENGWVAVRVVDTAANLDPESFETVGVTTYRSVDQEPLTLRETGPDTGVFEGRIRLRIGTFGWGNGYLEPHYLTDPPASGQVGVSYNGGPILTARFVQSILQLLDEEGAEATTIAPGQTLHLRVEAANGLISSELERVRVRARSLTTGDEETLYLLETGSFSYLAEGTLQPVPGTAAPNDGKLQVQTGEIVQVDHFDFYNDLRASDQVRVVRSAVRFVDESGRSVPFLLEGSPARVEVLDLLAAGQTPPAASIESRYGADLEDLPLTEPGTPGRFEASISPTRGWSSDNDGIFSLAPLTPFDRVTARSNGTSKVAVTIPALMEFLDEHGEPVAQATGGTLLRVRVRAPGLNASSTQAETLVGALTSRQAEDLEDLVLVETGPDSGVFTGTFPTLATQAAAGPDGLLMVRPEDTVTAVLDPEVFPYDGDSNRTVATLAIAPTVVEIVDGSGRSVSTRLFDEPVHLRVSEPEANASPASAESISVQVRAWRQGDGGADLETVSLTETGPDTGVFTGSLPTVTLSSPSPVAGNGFLEMTILHPVYRDATTVTAVRSGASDTVVFTDSELWLTNAQGQDATSFFIGSSIRVWVRRPHGNTTSGIDNEWVDVRIRKENGDMEGLALQETGGNTGLFTGLMPVGAAPGASWNNVLEGSAGDLVEATHGSGYIVFSFDRGVLTANAPPEAVDDSATTDEDTPVTIAVRTNDSDPEGSPLTLTAVTQGSKGSVAIAGGSVTYTPNANANGGDVFTYTVSDGSGGTDTATVTIQITPLPDPLVAVEDAAATSEGLSVVVPVLANDLNPDGGTLTVSQVMHVFGGSTTINPNNTITFAPFAGFDGEAVMTYEVVSSLGASDFGLVRIAVNGQNDPPAAGNDTGSTSEEAATEIAVLANDSDPELFDLTVTAVTQGAQGTVTITSGATRTTYTPAPDFNGTDSFTYTVADPWGLSTVATVTVTVTPVNDPPVALDDAATTPEDTTVSIAVLGNDTDVDGETLTVDSVTQSSAGTVTTDGTTVTFTPPANQSGTYVFTYTARDAANVLDTASVTVTVNALNDAPVAQPDAATTNEDTAVAISVLANDSDVDTGATLTVTTVTQGAKGAVTTNGTSLTYTPTANANGTDSFSYIVSDGQGGTATASVTVTINAVNDAPVAQPDAAAASEDTAVAISVLANDSDVDGNPLSITAVTQGAHGAVVSNGTGVTYTPAANFNGADAFTYTIGDGQGGTATASVTVSVAAVNDAPSAGPDSGATREAVPVIVAVLANDTDIEGSPLTVTAVGTPPNGSAVRLADNTVQYTPNPNFTGNDTFTYTLSDGQGGTSTGQVTVAVGEALERVAVLATNSAALRTGADVLSGDVIVNQAGAGPFLNGAELSVGGSVTTAASYDVEGDSLTIAAGAVIGSDVRSNQLTNSGTINGQQFSSLTLPVFSTLPAFLTATPGSTTINVGTNGTRTLAAGSYLDLIVGRKATVTFTGGTYHFRTIQVDREAKLYFSAASVIRVQQKLTTKNLTTIGPAVGAAIDASSIVFHVAGVNGTAGGLTATPKAVETGVDNTLQANVYAPNGTIWLQDRTQATGAFLGKDIDVGADAQVALDSAFASGQ